MNEDGLFFVDRSCINCDTCRQLAPEIFGDTGDYAYVRRQPVSDASMLNASKALIACPVGAIGMVKPLKAWLKRAREQFPERLTNQIYRCGFNASQSYGGHSYFIKHPDGNWLIDAPRFNRHLLRSFEQAGGISCIFYTHRDDVADGHKYAGVFKSKRIIHQAERSAQPDAESILRGFQPVRIHPDFLIIPVPGHTRGHCVLIYKEKYLFSGDHLWWSRHRQSLWASKDVCWYSWPEQIRSMEKLLDYSFEWVFPGHGSMIHLPPEVMSEQLRILIEKMKKQR